MAQVKISFYICDNPRCGKRFEGSPSKLPQGYTGWVRHNYGPNPSTDGDWYACKQSCIKPAIDQVLERIAVTR